MTRVNALRTKKEFLKQPPRNPLRDLNHNMTVNPTQAISFQIITEAYNGSVTLDVSDEKIFEAVKQINPLKTLGLDSTQAIFYHKSWNINR